MGRKKVTITEEIIQSSGPTVDYAVARLLGIDFKEAGCEDGTILCILPTGEVYSPTKNPLHGDPIIEKCGITLTPHTLINQEKIVTWKAYLCWPIADHIGELGDTRLEAGMRMFLRLCYEKQNKILGENK